MRTKELRHLVLRRNGVTFVWRSITLIEPEEREEDSQAGNYTPPELMPGYGTLKASWPQATAHSEEWASWNRAVEAAAKNIAARQDERVSGSWLKKWAADDDAEVTVTIGIVSERVITTFVDGWGWRGAHPRESSLRLNWLLKEERQLRPGDVFRTDSGWDRFIQERCDSDLRKELGDDYDDYHGTSETAGILHETIMNPENWRLDAKDLSIVYQDYDVAPRMLHPTPETVPWADLKPYLNSAFSLPR